MLRSLKFQLKIFFQSKQFKKLIIVFAVFFAFISGLIAGLYLFNWVVESEQELEEQSVGGYSEESLDLIEGFSNILLQSNDPSMVVFGISSSFIPIKDIQVFDYRFAEYSFPSYKVVLSDDELKQVQDHIQAAEGTIISDTLFGNYYDIHTPTWIQYHQGEVTDFIIKDGYACVISNGSNGVCPPLSEYCPKIEKYISCSNILYPINNNKEIVTSFINTLLASSGVSCAMNGSCNVSEAEIREYFEDLAKEVDYSTTVEDIELHDADTLVKEHVRVMEANFVNTNWTVNSEDVTEQSSKYNEDMLSIYQLSAFNNEMVCHSTISVFKYSEGIDDGLKKRISINCAPRPYKIGAIDNYDNEQSETEE